MMVIDGVSFFVSVYFSWLVRGFRLVCEIRRVLFINRVFVCFLDTVGCNVLVLQWCRGNFWGMVGLEDDNRVQDRVFFFFSGFVAFRILDLIFSMLCFCSGCFFVVCVWYGFVCLEVIRFGFLEFFGRDLLKDIKGVCKFICVFQGF